MAGRFEKEFAYTPIGTVQPNGQQVQWELINIFRYTDEGRLIEEWVQTDIYDFLRQLGPGLVEFFETSGARLIAFNEHVNEAGDEVTVVRFTSL
jgi:hypothetical protein